MTQVVKGPRDTGLNPNPEACDEIHFPCNPRVTQHPDAWKIFIKNFLIPSETQVKSHGSLDSSVVERRINEKKHDGKVVDKGDLVLAWQIEPVPKEPWAAQHRHVSTFTRHLPEYGMHTLNMKDDHNRWQLFNAVQPKDKAALPKKQLYGHMTGPDGEKHPQFFDYVSDEDQKWLKGVVSGV